MGVAIKDWNSERVVYKVVPEEVSQQEVKSYNDNLKLDREVDGWTKDRSVRKTGEIPFSVMYNYALSKGVPSTRIWEFYREDNCKNVKRLLNEFECFRCGTKFKGKL